MKKYILLILALFGGLLITQLAQATTLYDCYQSTGRGWPSVLERASDAASVGIWQYRGTAEQNTRLSSLLCPSGEQVGYSVVTGYEKNLRVSMNSTQTYVPVTSLALKDGTTLDMSKLGSRVFLTLEPGTAREEIVMCTNINTSTTNFDPCVRGLAFSGTSTASVSANQKTHGAGSKVVMSNVHYVYEELLDKDTNQTVSGTIMFDNNVTFNQIPAVTSSTFIPSSNSQLATKYYVDQVGSGGFTSLNASSTRGLQVYGTTPETVGVNVSTTKGMTIGADGSIYQKASSTAGLGQDENGTYVKIVTSTGLGFDSSGALQSTYASRFYGDGSDGALTVAAGTTTTLNLASSTYFVKNYTSLTIEKGGVLTFSGGHASGTQIFLKIQGDATVSGTIYAAGMGAWGGAGGALNTSGTAGQTIDNEQMGYYYHAGGFGVGGATAVGTRGGGAGAVSYASTSSYPYLLALSTTNLNKQIIVLRPGGGGGGGAGGDAGQAGTSGVGGAGGNGGGALGIFVGGTFYHTGTTTVSGINGVNGANGDTVPDVIHNRTAGGGGGGGGAGGMLLILYEKLGILSGTTTAYGGNGGNGGSGSCASSGSGASWGGGGGGAGSFLYASGAGGTGAVEGGSSSAAGTNGSGTYAGTGGTAGSTCDNFAYGGGGGGGGGGSGGTITITKNIWF